MLGHVDTGKTKLLDHIRSTSVQDREVGGITQQIGATYLPQSMLKSKTKILTDVLTAEKIKKGGNGRAGIIELPGILVIDTPGHESFSNLRTRGSSLCDIAILVVDIMHGLEPQTIESIKILRSRKTPFVVALNKIDCLYNWSSITNESYITSYESQAINTKNHFNKQLNNTIANFAAENLNACLYTENKDFRSWVSLVPTSAHTGEGIPDLILLITQICQKLISSRIKIKKSILECTILEVKKVQGLGTTIDVIVVNGSLSEGDTIVVCGLNGPIVTTIRALLTMKKIQDIRVKGEYINNKIVHAAISCKLVASGLDDCIAGSQLLVYNKAKDDLEELKDIVMEDLASIISQVDRSGRGVYVQASTLGSLEALLTFLKDMNIPVSGVALGNVQKKDVMKASIMLAHQPEYATILAFDVDISNDAKEQAIHLGVTIFTADIIYHLFDQFTEYMKKIKLERQENAKGLAIFPCIIEILPEHIYVRKSPIVIGIRVMEGILKLNTPLCAIDKEITNPITGVTNKLIVGIVESIEKDGKEIKVAKVGDEVCIKLAAHSSNNLLLCMVDNLIILTYYIVELLEKV